MMFINNTKISIREIDLSKELRFMDNYKINIIYDNKMNIDDVLVKILKKEIINKITKYKNSQKELPSTYTDFDLLETDDGK